MDINDAALRFLERRNRTKKEMKDHLAEKGFSKDDIGQCISYLENCNKKKILVIAKNINDDMKIISQFILSDPMNHVIITLEKASE